MCQKSYVKFSHNSESKHVSITKPDPDRPMSIWYDRLCRDRPTAWAMKFAPLEASKTKPRTWRFEHQRLKQNLLVLKADARSFLNYCSRRLYKTCVGPAYATQLR